MAERTNAQLLKSCEAQASVGSNPTPSASDPLDRHAVSASTCVVSCSATSSNGSIVCSARLRTTAPSTARDRGSPRTDPQQARRDPRSATARRVDAAKSGRPQRRAQEGRRSRSRRCTARTEQPERRFDRVRTSRHIADEVPRDLTGRRAFHAIDQLRGVVTGEVDGRGNELVFPLGEVVVDRSPRRTRSLQHPGKGRLLQAAFGEQQGSAHHHLPSGIAHHCVHLTSLPRRKRHLGNLRPALSQDVSNSPLTMTAIIGKMSPSS